jgi:erythromycin esterase
MSGESNAGEGRSVTSRRTFLATTGTSALTVAMAGCPAGSDGKNATASETDAESTDRTTHTATPTRTPETTETRTSEPTPTEPPEPTETQPPEGTQTEAERIADAFEAYTTPLETVDPGAPLADLEFLREDLDDARVIGMGEATHGTREFFQFKHRLLRYLAEELGLRLFAWEADFAATLAIDRYVRTGEGDPVEAIGDTGYWIWDVESVLTMVEWMREFNAGREPEDRISIYGVDMVFSGSAIDELEAFFQAADDDFLDSRDEAAEILRSDGLLEDESALETVTGFVPALQDHLETNEDGLVAATSRREYDRRRQVAAVLEQYIEYITARHQDADGNTSATRIRTRSMAENARWALEYENAAKLALWMHNLHLNRNRGKDTGWFLADWYGEDYYAIGMEFDHGSFQAREIEELAETESDLELGDVQAFTVGQAPEESLPGVLSKLEMEYAFVDLAAASDDDRLEPWLEDGPQRTILTSTYSPNIPEDRIRFAPEPITDDFDGLLFVEETDRARPL